MTVEIPIRRKYVDVTSGRNKSAGGNAGSSKTRRPQSKEDLAAAQEQTRRNTPTLHLVNGRKRTWVRPSR